MQLTFNQRHSVDDVADIMPATFTSRVPFARPQYTLNLDAIDNFPSQIRRKIEP